MSLLTLLGSLILTECQTRGDDRKTGSPTRSHGQYVVGRQQKDRQPDGRLACLMMLHFKWLLNKPRGEVWSVCLLHKTQWKFILVLKSYLCSMWIWFNRTAVSCVSAAGEHAHICVMLYEGHALLVSARHAWPPSYTDIPSGKAMSAGRCSLSEPAHPGRESEPCKAPAASDTAPSKHTCTTSSEPSV